MPNFVRIDLRALMRTLIVSLVGLAVFYSDGVFFDLTPWAQSLITASTSLGYDGRGQDKTVVVLFTEADLVASVRSDEVAFPIPYRLHRDVLHSISYAKPEAIFIDFAFLQKNRANAAGFADLVKEICRIHDTAIHEEGQPVRFTRVFILDTSQLGVAGVTAETFDGCATPVGAFINREYIGSGVMTYPKSGGSPFAEGSMSAAATSVSCQCAHGECAAGLSAAYALWASMPCDAASKGAADARRRLPAGDNMAVIWPALPSPRDTALTLCRKRLGLFEELKMIWRDGPPYFKRGCPYSHTLAAGDLLRPIAGEDVDSKLQGRVVFYGSKLALSEDTIRSPVFAEQPAIYYHAVAFDNLVSFGGKPKEPPGGFMQFGYGIVLVLVAAWLSFFPEPKKPTLDADQSLERFGWAVRGIFLLLAFGAFGVIYQITFLETNAPEYLLLAAFVLFTLQRFAKAPRMGWLSLLCFAIFFGLYLGFGISFEKFLAMVVSFEIFHLMLSHLATAADKLRRFYNGKPVRPMRWSEWLALKLLWPFLTHKEHA